MTALLEAIEVEVRFQGMDRPAVVAADIVVNPGAAIGIVGESGSGKTTFAHTLVGALKPTRGEVLIGGKRWSRVGRRDDARRQVQMIFQDPVGALNPWMGARDAVAEVVQHWYGVSRGDARRRAGDLLSETGLTGDAIDRRPRELSGGQCQRVGIARALACKPDIIVADEPTSALDVSVQAQILNLLVALQHSHDLALILISHDLSVVQHMTDDAVVMYGGRIVERGKTDELMERPAHPYTRLLVESTVGVELSTATTTANAVRSDHPCPFAHRCPALRADCETVLEHPGPKAPVVCRYPLQRGVSD